MSEGGKVLFLSFDAIQLHLCSSLFLPVFCVTAFASLTLAADSMIYYSIHTFRLMCAHTQPLGTLMLGQKEGVVPPEELSRAKCNCIGG